VLLQYVWLDEYRHGSCLSYLLKCIPEPHLTGHPWIYSATTAVTDRWNCLQLSKGSKSSCVTHLKQVNFVTSQVVIHYHHLHWRIFFKTKFNMLGVPGMVNTYCTKLISLMNISWHFENLSVSVTRHSGCYDFHSHKKEWGVWRNLPCWTKLLLG
jgi:hypothetical protein